MLENLDLIVGCGLTFGLILSIVFILIRREKRLNDEVKKWENSGAKQRTKERYMREVEKYTKKDKDNKK